MYAWISGCGENERVHPGLRAKEYEEVLSLLRQADGGAESGEPAADDQGVDLTDLRVGDGICNRKTHVFEARASS